MLETARLALGNAGLRLRRRMNLPALIVLFAFALGGAANVGSVPLFLLGLPSKAHAQTPDTSKQALRANIKTAAERLNDIASVAPDMIRSMFAGKTPSASLLGLDEKSIAAQSELENAILTAQKGGALSEDEAKELARLGELAKKTRDPVKEDIETLKSVPDLPIIGRDPAVRLAPKSQQDASIANAEAAKRAVGELVAAIRKLP